MSRDLILPKILQTVSVVFDMDVEDVSLKTSAKNVAKWDSLNQVKLIVALEEELDMEFEPEEIAEMNSVKAIMEVAAKKITQ